MASPEGIQGDDEPDLKISPDAPVALPVSSASGNPLRTVHSFRGAESGASDFDLGEPEGQ